MRWLDITLGVAATIVSLVSLWLGLHSAHSMEKLVAANSFPYVELIRSSSEIAPQPGADRDALVAEAVRRGRAFLEAGAPVVFVPRVSAREEVAALVEGLGRGRLSVITAPGATLGAADLQELGVARVSTGPFTQRVALTALQDAAAEVVGGGVLPAGTRPLN